ncbi:g1601 [Coccomyxa elongata]
MSEAEECTTSGREHQSPWERVSQAFRFATSRVEPGDPVPEVPAELKEWAENTAMGTLAGMLYCGGRQFLQNRREGSYKPPQGGLSSAQMARLIAEENTRRLIRLGNETLRGGLRFGALTGLFFGVQLLSSIARNKRDMQDTVNAALVTGGLFGSLLPGSSAFRLRSAILGAALGGVVAVPASMLQEQVAKLAPEGTQGAIRHTGLSGGPVPSAQDYRPERYSLRERDSAADVIARLEHGLYDRQSNESSDTKR